MFKTKLIGVQYYLQVGKESVDIIATAEKISDKRCRIVKVVEINGEPMASTWGALGWQHGKIKNISNCSEILIDDIF